MMTLRCARRWLPAMVLCAAVGAAVGTEAAAAPPARTAPAAHHPHQRAHERGPHERAASHGLSLDQAVALVERRFHARVLRADRHAQDGHTVYVLRLLNDRSGRVWSVRVDAATGAIH